MLVELMTSEIGITIVGGAIGIAWTGFKSLDWIEQRRQDRHTVALMAIEAGVEHSFQTYVRAIKAARANGKLTQDERKHARALAWNAAIRMGRAQGVNVVRELGHDFVPVWISRMVRELKRRR